MVLIVVSQVNLLLGHVNDILDHNLIVQGRFVSKNELFCLKEAFSFVIDIFEIHRTKVFFKEVACIREQPFSKNELKNYVDPLQLHKLPE